MNYEKSNDAKIVEHILSQAAVGDTVLYDTLSIAIGRDVRLHAWGAINTARRSLLNNKKYVFEVEKNVGLTRLDDSQIVDSSESDRAKMKRAANRTLKKLSVVEFEKLPDAQKRKHTVMAAQIGAVAMFAGKSATKKIESKVDASKSVLAIGETLKLFS